MSSLLLPYNRRSYDEGGMHDVFQRVDKCAGELRSAVYPLPRVDERGRSECPFKDELYDKAEGWSDELKRQIDQLRDHREGARRAMQRCEQAERNRHRDQLQRIDAKIDQAVGALKDAATDVAGRCALSTRIGL